jgi:hypothetical protein
MFKSAAKPLSGRYLSLAEREDISLLLVQGHSLQEIGRRLGRCASTISREVRRNATTRGGALDYRATVAQWHAERSARRPKKTKLAGNAALRSYVEERLAGVVRTGYGHPVPRPAVSWKGRRHGPRQDRRWAWAWSPEQIARRLAVDFPDDETMRISHEAIYQALFVQGRGALRRELTACLRTGRTLRTPRARVGLRGKTFVSSDIMISQRSAEADDRAVPGHWEGDLILGAGQLGDRHAGRAHDTLHDATAPAAYGRAWRWTEHQERASAGGTRCRGGAQRDRAYHHHLAAGAASVAHLGSRSRDGAACPPQG